MAKTDKTSNIYIDGKQAGNTIAELRAASRRLNNEINQMAPGTDRYKRKVAELGKVKGQLTDHRNEIKKVSGSYKNVRKSMGGVQSMVKGFLGAGAIMGAVRGIVRGVGNWIKTNAQLSASLSSLKSITGASTQDIKFYKEEAIRLGASTTQSATQVVDAMKLIGSAKPELLSNKQALSDVTEETIRLAEAGEINMQASADSLTGALNQWGEGAGEAARFTNVLAAGSKAGAANIESLGQSINKSGAVMAGYNVSIEQGVGLLETMAERNLKGAEAGTQLRNVMLTMQGVDALPEKAIAQLEKYGVNTDIVRDKTQPLNARLAEMAKISGDATAMMEVFGRENIVAAGAILENTDKVDSFTESVTDTNTAMEQQKINNDNLKGDTKQLSSAWEGLTLTIGAGEKVLRFFVQTLTSAIRWVTNLISAFQEWDTLELENIWLRAQKSLAFFNSELQRNLDRQIRVNELSQEMIGKVQGQVRSLHILTGALRDNNERLKEGNLNTDEATKLKEQNGKIVDKLKDKYPELTDEIDLQSMSSQELIKWQREAGNVLLDNIAKEVEATQKKKLLNEMIQKQMELSQKQAEESAGFLNEALAVFTSGMNADQFKQLDLAEDAQEIRNIGLTWQQTSSDVQMAIGQIKGMNLNFARDFDITSENIDKQREKVEKLGKSIEERSQKGIKINAQEIAQYRGLKKALDTWQEQQDARIEKELRDNEKVKNLKIQNMEDGLEKEIALIEQKYDQEIENAEGNAEIIEQLELAKQKAIDKARKDAVKGDSDAADARKKELEKLRDRLQDLADFEKEVNQEKNREVALANKEGLEKELQERQFAIEDKYKEQIQSAQELAEQEGRIGAEGADKLANLKALKEEELMNLKSDIQKRQLEEQEKAEEEAAQERAEARIRIEDSLWNTKMTLLRIKLDETGQFEVEKRQQILEEIKALEREKANTDLERQKQELQTLFENKEISQEEMDIRLEEKEAEHQRRLTDINREASEERKKIKDEEIQNVIDGAQMAVDVYSAFQKLEHDAEMARIDERAQSRIEKLDTALRANQISQEQYDKEVEDIEETADERRRELQIEDFERQKKLSLVQVAIDTATAIMKAIAQFGPPPSAMGIAGIASASALGVAQAAAILSQQPQFAEGGFTTVTGAEDGKSYNARIRGKAKPGMLPGGPQLVLANEKGPEYFIPNPMLNDPQVIDHVRAIENIRVRQFAEGGATAQMPEGNTTAAATGIDDQLLRQMMNYLQTSTMTMNQLRQELKHLTVIIGDGDIDQLQERMAELDQMRA